MLKVIGYVCILSALVGQVSAGAADPVKSLCLDGFCIGQSINDSRFDQVEWIVPAKDITKLPCAGIGCRPEVAFRGYRSEDAKQLAEVLSSAYGLSRHNVITKGDLATIRKYKYECDASPRGIAAQRRFFGAYLSAPSKYLTVVGLRLIRGELKVYRIARQYPYHNQDELVSLGKKLRGQYGGEILFYDYLSSNAYSDVIRQKKDGWFGRSTMFNPVDMSNNAAELVLIDPETRDLLEPSDMPESGEIKPLPVRIPDQCSRPLPIQ